MRVCVWHLLHVVIDHVAVFFVCFLRPYSEFSLLKVQTCLFRRSTATSSTSSCQWLPIDPTQEAKAPRRKIRVIPFRCPRQETVLDTKTKQVSELSTEAARSFGDAGVGVMKNTVDGSFEMRRENHRLDV